jgi:DNA invertase Pin-like site-specific DNA recombinase
MMKTIITPNLAAAMTIKIAAYVRVSTKDQKTDMQIEDIKKFCEFKWPGLTPALFVDHAESGAKTSRPAFDAMMEKARKKEFQVLLTWKFDRIGRSTIHLISIMEELKSLGIDFISLKENIDTTTAMGKMIFTIFAALAEFERETIKMRTKAGRDIARSKGIHLGRPMGVSENELARMFALYESGRSGDAIARLLNIPRSTVYRILKDGKND